MLDGTWSVVAPLLYVPAMKTNDPGIDEVWLDFYATLPKGPSHQALMRKRREAMIHFVWLYTQVASTGTKRPINDLAEKIGCTVEEVAEMVQRSLNLKLLLAPKRGSYRCELSVIAVRMIGRMKIGLSD